MPSELFGPIARMLVACPLVPQLAARQASAPAALDRLLRGTGSTLDADGVALYRRLVASPGHVEGALAMMANWGLRPLAADLPRLTVKLILVTGAGDRTIPPADSDRVRRLVPSAEAISLPGLGHLAHEEKPGQVVEIILAVARDALVLEPA
jgi:magnesium chelatase accessory protein